MLIAAFTENAQHDGESVSDRGRLRGIQKLDLMRWEDEERTFGRMFATHQSRGLPSAARRCQVLGVRCSEAVCGTTMGPSSQRWIGVVSSIEAKKSFWYAVLDLIGAVMSRQDRYRHHDHDTTTTHAFHRKKTASRLDQSSHLPLSVPRPPSSDRVETIVKRRSYGRKGRKRCHRSAMIAEETEKMIITSAIQRNR